MTGVRFRSMVLNLIIALLYYTVHNCYSNTGHTWMPNGAIRAHPSNTYLSTSTKVLIELQHLLLMCRTKMADNIKLTMKLNSILIVGMCQTYLLKCITFIYTQHTLRMLFIVWIVFFCFLYVQLPHFCVFVFISYIMVFSERV